MVEVIAVPDRVGEFPVERFGDDQDPRRRIFEHEAVVGLGHQRVDRDRHDAGLDGAEKSRRPVDGVEEADQNAFLAAAAERAQHLSEALDPVGKRGIGVLAAGIDIGEFVAAAGIEIALEDIGGEIVVARDGDSGGALLIAAFPHQHGLLPTRCPQQSIMTTWKFGGNGDAGRHCLSGEIAL